LKPAPAARVAHAQGNGAPADTPGLATFLVRNGAEDVVLSEKARHQHAGGRYPQAAARPSRTGSTPVRSGTSAVYGPLWKWSTTSDRSAFHPMIACGAVGPSSAWLSSGRAARYRGGRDGGGSGTHVQVLMLLALERAQDLALQEDAEALVEPEVLRGARAQGSKHAAT
jgi:hypothetical protein